MSDIAKRLRELSDSPEHAFSRGTLRWAADEIEAQAERLNEMGTTIAGLQAEVERLAGRVEAAEQWIDAMRRGTRIPRKGEGVGPPPCPRCGGPLSDAGWRCIDCGNHEVSGSIVSVG